VETESTTPPVEEVDVGNDDNQSDVETESGDVQKTNDDSYAEAWDSINVDEEPPAGLFGETTTEVEPQQEEEPQVEENKNGLYISNPVLKFKGKDIPIESEEELIALAQKGFKLETEMSKIKPYKAIISVIKDSELTMEDIKALADMKGGNAKALDYLKKSAGIQDDENIYGRSIFDEETKTADQEYTPEVPVQDQVAEYFKEYAEQKPDIGGKVASIYAELDDDFKAQIYNPKVFPGFVNSIETGEFEKVYPMAVKLKAINGALSWLEAYYTAGQQMNILQQEEKRPPKDVEIPANKTPGRQIKKKADYDTAFNMDLEELEAKLFG
jgi:hypothetical protein